MGVRLLIYKSIVIILGLCCFGRSYGDSAKIGIIGDSMSTGAAAHPDLYFGREAMVSMMTGRRTLEYNEKLRDQALSSGFTPFVPPEFPLRLPPSQFENDGPLSWVLKNSLYHFTSLYLDSEELSWGGILGRSFDVEPSNILIAAEDGARVTESVRQVDRILVHTKGNIPSRIFMFFTSNDLCSPLMNGVTSSEDYGASIVRTLRYLIRNGLLGPDGVDIFIMDPIGIMQLMQTENLKNKMVRANGTSMSCQDLYKYNKQIEPPSPEELKNTDPMITFLMQYFPRSPSFYCPIVLGRALDSEGDEDQVVLANRIRSYRDEITNAISLYNKKYLSAAHKAKVRVRQITETGKFSFQPEDLAEDCFHLSYQGHIKLAKMIKNSIVRP